MEIFIWLLCSVASFWLLIFIIREEFDVNWRDITFCCVISIFGPASLVAAIFVFLAGWIGPKISNKVVWKRRQ